MNDKLKSNAFAKKIKDWGIELGFNHVGITDANLKSQKKSYQKWIKLIVNSISFFIIIIKYYIYIVFFLCSVFLIYIENIYIYILIL